METFKNWFGSIVQIGVNINLRMPIAGIRVDTHFFKAMDVRTTFSAELRFGLETVDPDGPPGIPDKGSFRSLNEFMPIARKSGLMEECSNETCTFEEVIENGNCILTSW